MSETSMTSAGAAVAVREALRQASSPLSACQQRVWRLAVADPDTTWSERIALRLSGPLPVDAFSAALDGLVRRHAILRTVFVVLDGAPMQCVRRAARGGLLVVDLEALPPHGRERATRRAVLQQHGRPMDVRRGPLLRCALIRQTPQEHVFVLTLHHLVFDGWSQSVMLRELATLFIAATMGLPAALPELRVQYGDLARREQHPAGAGERRNRLAQVVERLRGLRPAASLPLDRARPPYASHRAGSMPFVVPEDVWGRLRTVVEGEQVTPFVLGLAAVALALRATHASIEEVSVGVAVANRASLEAQALIGPFVNIVAVRIPTTAGMTVRQLLRSVRTALLDAVAFQDVPFDDVMNALDGESPKGSYGPAGRPLFRVCADFTEVGEAPAPSAAALTITPFETGGARSGCDLYVSFSATRATLRGIVLYSAELFDAPTVEAFVDRLQRCAGSLDRQLASRLDEVHL